MFTQEVVAAIEMLVYAAKATEVISAAEFHAELEDLACRRGIDPERLRAILRSVRDTLAREQDRGRQ